MSERKLPLLISGYSNLFAELSETHSLSEIGKRYGISKQRVSFIIRNGSNQKLQKINGMSLKEYCKKHGLRYWAIRRYVYEDGLSPLDAVSKYRMEMKTKIERELSALLGAAGL